MDLCESEPDLQSEFQTRQGYIVETMSPEKKSITRVFCILHDFSCVLILNFVKLNH